MSENTERLDAIQARVDATTPGPWEWSKEEDGWGDCGPNLETVKRGPVYSDGSQGADELVIGSWGHDANGISVEPFDAEFIAAAPSDVAFLLDLVRKQEAQLDAVESLATGWTLRGESDMAFSKTLPDPDIADAILTKGAGMVENARHIRNALDAK